MGTDDTFQNGSVPRPVDVEHQYGFPLCNTLGWCDRLFARVSDDCDSFGALMEIARVNENAH
jgi:hypothetical protein